jgi:predicted protein tyrosine phosphatase
VDLNELKRNWNDILFLLEQKNRVAWLTFFDARLVKLEDRMLYLDFSDSEKFSGAHSYSDARAKFASLLKESIKEISGVDLELSW